jgi:hypothetical protein
VRDCWRRAATAAFSSGADRAVGTGGSFAGKLGVTVLCEGGADVVVVEVAGFDVIVIGFEGVEVEVTVAGFAAGFAAVDVEVDVVAGFAAVDVVAVAAREKLFANAETVGEEAKVRRGVRYARGAAFEEEDERT